MVGFKVSKMVMDCVSEAFKHAASVGAEIDRLEEKSKAMRESCANGIVTTSYRDQVVSGNAAEIERLKNELDVWLADKAAEVRGEADDAFVIDVSTLDQARSAFLASVDLSADELTRLTGEAMADSDAATLRMLESNAARSGTRYQTPVPAYLDAVAGVFELASAYAVSSFTGDGSSAYRDNLPAIFEKIEGQIEKAERAACAPCL